MKNSSMYRSIKNKGLFITFEGGEGVGKTTQIKLLESYLLNLSYNVVCSREPGGTIEGESIRNLLISGTQRSWDPLSEALMFNASRRHHINNVIHPSLKKGCLLLCDRFIDSTIVYQGYAGSIKQSILTDLHKKFCYNLYPDLTFFRLKAFIRIKKNKKKN